MRFREKERWYCFEVQSADGPNYGAQCILGLPSMQVLALVLALAHRRRVFPPFTAAASSR